MTTAQLALERQRLQEEIAAKRHLPEERLTEVETALDERWTHEQQRVADARAEYERAADAYVPAQEQAIQAMRAFVSAVEAAQEARRVMEAAGRQDGARSAPLPESVRVKSGRRGNEELVELRGRARIAASVDF